MNNLSNTNILNLLIPKLCQQKTPPLYAEGFLLKIHQSYLFFLSKSTTIGVDIHNEE